MKYLDLRPHIKTGDAILWKGRGPVSLAIRLFSNYSHASLVIRADKYFQFRDRVFLIEALGDGLVPRALSRRIKGYSGQVVHFGTNMTDEQRRTIGLWAVEKCIEGVPYDFGGIFKNILGRVSLNAHRYFCSEFLWDGWLGVGYAQPRADNKAPRPGDLPRWVEGTETMIN